MVKSFNTVKQAKRLREKGFSFEEIGNKFKISKSTAFHWTKNIILDSVAKERIKSRERRGLAKAYEIRQRQRNFIHKEIKQKANKYLSELNLPKNIDKLFCSLLYWAEGAKINANKITFINSDPKMIGIFLRLFRSAFKIEENKFRCLVHIHEYHNEKSIKKYWSKITNIPLSQFNKSYLKPHTKKRIRKDYKEQ